MAQCATNKKRLDSLTVTLLVVIAVLAVLGTVFSSSSGGFISAMDGVILTLLTLATDVLYLIGGGVIFFGACVVAARFLQCKLKDSYKPSCATRYLSGYLTLSLEFFIGAEIIKTTTTRTWEEFSVLILIILSRGLFSLILYLERRWHGAAETE
jgi:uncharacterized membrane protein